MAEVKTKITKSSVSAYLNKIPAAQRADAKKVAALLSGITKKKPTLWSNGMIGYGTYHYKSERSSQEGDWPLIGFSVRKNNITMYLMGGMGAAQKHSALLKKLGKHTASSGSCLYIKRLDDVDMTVLKKICSVAYAEMKKKYG
jgi:hypothetical protein